MELPLQAVFVEECRADYRVSVKWRTRSRRPAMSNDLCRDQEQKDCRRKPNVASRRLRNDAFGRRRRLLPRRVGPSRRPLYVERGRDGREAKRTFHFECRES